MKKEIVLIKEKSDLLLVFSGMLRQTRNHLFEYSKNQGVTDKALIRFEAIINSINDQAIYYHNQNLKKMETTTLKKFYSIVTGKKSEQFHHFVKQYHVKSDLSDLRELLTAISNDHNLFLYQHITIGITYSDIEGYFTMSISSHGGNLIFKAPDDFGYKLSQAINEEWGKLDK